MLPLTNPKQAKRPETLFEANPREYGGHDSSDSGTDESSPHRLPIPQTQQKQRVVQTPAYLVDSSEESEEYAGPVAASQHRFDIGKDEDEDEEDDLDQFKNSGMGEEDFGLPVATKPVTIPPSSNRTRASPSSGTPTIHSPPSTGTTPRGLGGVGLGVGFNADRRIGAGGLSPATIQIQGRAREKERQPGERMLTSTQELNMKSQFLMNMNTKAYGDESVGSSRHSRSGSGSGGSLTASAAGSRTHSRAQSYSLSQAQSLSLSQSLGQGGSQQARESQQSMGSGLTSAANLKVSSGMGLPSDDEDEGSQLGPGSDFFK